MGDKKDLIKKRIFENMRKKVCNRLNELIESKYARKAIYSSKENP